MEELKQYLKKGLEEGKFTLEQMVEAISELHGEVQTEGWPTKPCPDGYISDGKGGCVKDPGIG